MASRQPIDKNENSGTITGAREIANDKQLNGEIRYPAIRKSKTDVAKIANNTGYSVEDIQRIKNYLFIEEHDLGDGEIGRFAPDDEIAKSWDRLTSGKDIRPQDLTLLNHELLENQLVDSGLDRNSAHIEAKEI